MGRLLLGSLLGVLVVVCVDCQVQMAAAPDTEGVTAVAGQSYFLQLSTLRCDVDGEDAHPRVTCDLSDEDAVWTAWREGFVVGRIPPTVLRSIREERSAGRDRNVAVLLGRDETGAEYAVPVTWDVGDFPGGGLRFVGRSVDRFPAWFAERPPLSLEWRTLRSSTASGSAPTIILVAESPDMDLLFFER